MLINEVITESIVDEYRVRPRYNPMPNLKRGDRNRNLYKPVKTPLTQFDIRYNFDSPLHDYYMYDKQTGKCVGLFTIEDLSIIYSHRFKDFLQPGIKVVTPHMALGPEAQRQGISTLAYTTFLRGGPWVFMTEEHTQGASKLWDSLAKGDIISFYLDRFNNNELSYTPTQHSVRFLGPKDRFKLPN